MQIRPASFNLAIEFGPVHAIPSCGTAMSRRQVSISQSSLGRFTLASPDGASEANAVSISQSSLGRFPHQQRPPIVTRQRVSISQSSLGRFTPAQSPPPNRASTGFNLAIEFGPVHAYSQLDPERAQQRFQSRNRVWGGSRRTGALSCA